MFDTILHIIRMNQLDCIALVFFVLCFRGYLYYTSLRSVDTCLLYTSDAADE